MYVRRSSNRIIILFIYFFGFLFAYCFQECQINSPRQQTNMRTKQTSAVTGSRKEPFDTNYFQAAKNKAQRSQHLSHLSKIYFSPQSTHINKR